MTVKKQTIHWKAERQISQGGWRQPSSKQPSCNNYLLYFAQVSSLINGQQSSDTHAELNSFICVFFSLLFVCLFFLTAATCKELKNKDTLWLRLGAEHTEMTFYYTPWQGLIDFTSHARLQ